jgi:CBS domain-containing protein
MLVETILDTSQKKLVTIKHTAPVVEVARLLARKEANLVVVCDPTGIVAGVVAKTDIVRQVSTCQGFNCTAPVSSMMTRTVLTCHGEDFLKDVWSTMKSYGLKHIPIVDGTSKPIGLAIARDVLVRLMEDVEYEEQLLRDYVMCIGYH